ncbi:MAG: phospholipase [Alphaproteobacteria bacterium]|nr:phospholipase [Alphaproteobacteria bacterium]
MALSGPTLAPARGPATHLVVLVHGYGADGQDLLGLANHWQGVLPTVAFAAPNAPTRVPGSSGYQWFPISRIDPHEMQKGVEVAGPQLDEYMDGELARLGLPPENLALAGFSQGTMLSLHVGLRRKVRPAAIVGFSGLLAGLPPPGEIPPVLLTHGDSDKVIPPQAMFMAATQLGAAGARVQWHLAHGMGHGIDPEGLAIAGEFLDLAFRGLLKSQGDTTCVLKPS